MLVLSVPLGQVLADFGVSVSKLLSLDGFLVVLPTSDQARGRKKTLGPGGMVLEVYRADWVLGDQA